MGGGFNYDYDYGYDNKYKEYIHKIPRFVRNYAQRMERLFNQKEFNIQIKNLGNIQAENLLIEVCISEGCLHDRFSFISPRGPAAPQPERYPHLNIPDLYNNLIHHPVGRHEFDYRKAPNSSRSFSVTCEDFRQGGSWSFDGVLSIDARAIENTNIAIEITASNYRGKFSISKILEKNVHNVHVSELIDMENLKTSHALPMQTLLEKGDFDNIDFDSLDAE